MYGKFGWNGFEGNISKLYLFSFLSNFLIFTPVVVLFFQENGLNLTQVMLLQSAYSISQIILEVPSGYFADIYGRKNSLLLGSGVLAIGIFFYALGQDFTHFLLAEIIFSVGGALHSGSRTAILYDSLVEINQEEIFKKVRGRSQSIRLVSGAVASVAGGLIAEYSIRATLSLTAVPLFFMIPVAYSVKKTNVHKIDAEPDYANNLIRILRENLLENKQIRYLMLFVAVLGASTHVAFFLYQPYLKQISIPITYFGVIFAASNLFSALISEKAHWIEEKIGMEWSMTMVYAATVAGFALLGFNPVWFSFIFIGLHQFSRGLMNPLASDFVNKLTSSTDRSTVLSIKSLLHRLVYSVWIPFIGMISDSFGVIQAISLMGVMLAAIALPLFLVLQRIDVL